MLNNKGLTLIELLAVMVILGIIFVFSIPAITKMVDNGRDKIYITDAKKLVALAEKEVNSSNVDIEKPDPGDCIIISLLYFNGTDLDHSPYDGEYLKSNSFVVVKNNSGTMEYSVALVEQIKDGGYKGIDLIKSSELKKKGAIEKVKGLLASELLNPDSINAGTINNKLGSGYVSNISGVYNTINYH